MKWTGLQTNEVARAEALGYEIQLHNYRGLKSAAAYNTYIYKINPGGAPLLPWAVEMIMNIGRSVTCGVVMGAMRTSNRAKAYTQGG